jgi:hypothetical protein
MQAISCLFNFFSNKAISKSQCTRVNGKFNMIYQPELSSLEFIKFLGLHISRKIGESGFGL